MTTSNKDTNDVRWDLSVLYSGLEDPQLDKDISIYVEMCKSFQAAHKAKLAETIGQALRDMLALTDQGTRFGAYLFLRYTADTGDAAIKARKAKMEKVTSEASGQYMSFFAIEVATLDDAVLTDWYAKDEVVAKHRPYLEAIRRFKPHQLTEEVESALTKRGPFGEGAWSEFYEELEADLRFAWKDGQVPLSEILYHLTTSNDADERATALKSLNDGLSGTFAKYAAQTLYMVMGAKEVEDRERGFAHPMHAANKGSQIPDAVVEALHRSVIETGGPLCRQYYKLKAKLLGFKTLRWSDRNAPMPFADHGTISWTEAVTLVQCAYRSFSPTLADLVDGMVRDKRVDVAPRPGKHSGAYNYSFCMPDGTPISFVLLNFRGSRRDAITAAHEFGHGCHGLLAGEVQGPLMQHAPIPEAETASIFGEMITYNNLKADLKAKSDMQALLALIMSKCDDLLNSAIRQISFSNFERRVHAHDAATMARGITTKLSVPELNAIWLEVTHELYGKPGEVFTYENSDHLWAYVPHFHRPFYVYGYAFGELLTQSLYAAQPRLGERFESLYLDLLRAGDTKDVVELLKPFGLDPTDDAFWRSGLEVSLGKMIEEAEDVATKLGLLK